MATWTKGLHRIGLALVVTSGVIVPAGLQAQSTAEQAPTEHAKAQVGRLHQIKQLVANGQTDAARKMIAGAQVQSRTLAATDPGRLDGEEAAVALLAAEENFVLARAKSDTVVAFRRTGPANEQLLLCWSLVQHAIILDGTGATTEADKALQEAISAARNAFPLGDRRRPQMLEAFADLMARGYNRPLAGIGLYEAAIEIREAMPDGSPQELAEVLRKLAVIEPAQGLDVSADAHLQRAIQILETEAAAAKDAAAKTEVSGDLGTLYGQRIGLAARAQRYGDARNMLGTARALAANTATAPYIELYSAEVDRRESESRGDITAALAAIRNGVIRAKALPDAQPSLVAALELVEARLQVEASDLDGAEATINRALKTLADLPTPEGARTAEGWLLLARIERARGHEVRANRWVTGALAMLKTRRSEVSVLFGTNRAQQAREPGQFGSVMAPELSFGEALVLVPGQPPIPGTGLSTLGGATGLDRLLVTNIKSHDLMRFGEAAMARTAGAKIYPRTALVFVHGFGTTFEFALARAAQIGRDIAYDGPVFSFTWPSQGKPDASSYSADEKAAQASAGKLTDFLTVIADVTGADKIHIIAHSMGNQVLLKALGQVQRGQPALAAKIGEIVFASPDVDQSEFKAQTAALSGHRMTLYASAYDKALWISFLRNASIRAGSVSFGLLSSGTPVLTRGVDSIDVSDAGRDYFSFNHDTYSSSPHVANDLRRLLQSGDRPPARRSAGVLVERGKAPEQYWVFEAKKTR